MEKQVKSELHGHLTNISPSRDIEFVAAKKLSRALFFKRESRRGEVDFLLRRDTHAAARFVLRHMGSFYNAFLRIVERWQDCFTNSPRWKTVSRRIEVFFLAAACSCLHSDK